MNKPNTMPHSQEPGFRARVSSIALAGCIITLILGVLNCQRHLGHHLVQARDGLYLRAEPIQSAQSIELMPSGAQLSIIEYDSFFPRCTQGTCGYWAKVDYLGSQGFAFQGFLKPVIGNEESETPGIVISGLLMTIFICLGFVAWLKRGSLKRLATSKGNGPEGSDGLSIRDRMLNAGESLARKVNAHLEKRRTEHEVQYVDLVSQERMNRLRELSIRYVQDTSQYQASPLFKLSVPQITLAIFALGLACYAALYVLVLMDLIVSRKIDEGYWLLVILQIPGVLLPFGICAFSFSAGTGFNVVNLVRYYLFFRGIDLVIIFILFKYPSLRIAVGQTLKERSDLLAFVGDTLIAVGIFMLFALYCSRSKRVKIRYGQYLKFGQDGSIFGIFPSVVRVTEEEASQLVDMAPTQTEGGSATASSKFVGKSESGE